MTSHQQKNTLILLLRVSHETLRKTFTLGNCKVLTSSAILLPEKKIFLINIIQQEDKKLNEILTFSEKWKH